MKRRTFIAGLAVATAVPGLSFGQERILNEVSAYLNALRSVKGRFTQFNSDGSRSTGEYTLQRPGKIRFDYDGSDAMVLADGVNVGVFDPKSSQIVQRYPLKATPLRFLLRRDIDLTEKNLTRKASSERGYTYVTLQDPRAPRDGSMLLEFQNDPARLIGWTTVDKSGQQTSVRLDSMEKVSGLGARMFSIEWHELQIKNSR